MVDAASPGALEGVRVLDFCRLGFGSQATMILGCLGAEVIRIESTTRPDPIRVMPPFVPEPGEVGQGFGGATLAQAQKQQSANRGGIFYKYNTGGKRSIAVDARNPDGLEVLRRLVARERHRHRELRRGHPGPLGSRATRRCASCDPTSSTCRCAATGTSVRTRTTSRWARPRRH